MLIANRTSHSANRWVDLKDDGTAVASTVSRPMNVSVTENGKEVTYLQAKVLERPLTFTDREDLSRKAYRFIRTGAVE